jgi:hypothetical protein
MSEARWSKVEGGTEGQEIVPSSQLDEVSEPGFDAGALSTAYSIFTTGCETTRARHFLNGLNIEAPPGNELNKALKFVGEKIMRMADESCSEVKGRLDPGTVISLDGSWDHRRKGSRCFVVVCNQNTGEVLSYIVMSNKVPPNDPNYCEVPQNMEVSGMARLIDDLKKYPEIVGYVHDNDAKFGNYSNFPHGKRSLNFWILDTL